MRCRPKSKKANLVILVIGLIAILAAGVCGFASTRSAMRIGYVGSEGWSNWSGRYMMLDGTMQKSIHPDGDTLHVAVETKSGAISIEIRNADGTVIFEEENMETTSFDVQASGKVVVRITADNHKGSFQISG